MVEDYDIDVPWNRDLDSWWHEEIQNVSEVCESVWVEKEHMLFILYTSGSSGKTKGCVLTTCGYMIFAALTFKYTFDCFPGDVYLSM
ncbi:unnamed protein product [Larinioides sclopetarius]|uniref:acetate--CoA ligase n=1 Tax=Larinioides sclopetarius TaxID=280406 RepID=A0AAV1ZN79_9ARAC